MYPSMRILRRISCLSPSSGSRFPGGGGASWAAGSASKSLSSGAPRVLGYRSTGSPGPGATELRHSPITESQISWGAS